MSGTFSLQLRRFSRRALEHNERLKRAVAINLFSAVIMDSPVDTGRLRSNWQVGNGDINRDDSTTATNESLALLTMMTEANKATLEQPIFLTNSLDYVHRIEYLGWSHTKAPQGMVHKNVRRFRAILSAEVNSLRRGGA